MFNNSNTGNVDDHPYSYYSSSSSSCFSSPVDCTLSLGSASTRQSTVDHRSDKMNGSTTSGSSEISTISGIYWDMPRPPVSSRSTSGGGFCAGDGRRCANCSTTSTPLWRNGPNGPKSLCNACGIRYKKVERKAASEATISTPALMYSSSPTVVEPNRLSTIGCTSGRKTKGQIPQNNVNLAYCYNSWCLNAPSPRAEFLQH